MDLWCDVDEAEVARRSQLSLKAVTDESALRLLMELPYGAPLVLDSIHPLDRVLLDDLPTGVVALTRRTVTRTLVPPVRLTGIALWADSREEVERLLFLRSHAPRVAIGEDDLVDGLLRCAPLDLGLASPQANGVKVVRPASSRWVRPSWQRWLTSELAFCALASQRQPR